MHKFFFFLRIIKKEKEKVETTPGNFKEISRPPAVWQFLSSSFLLLIVCWLCRPSNKRPHLLFTIVFVSLPHTARMTFFTLKTSLLFFFLTKNIIFCVLQSSHLIIVLHTHN